MRRHALLILNNGSRQGQTDLAPALEVLRGGGISLRQEAGRSPDDVSRLIREHRGQVDMVVLAGGDGTLQCAAPGLLDSGLPMGILPLGTANDLARTLRIPLDPKEAAEQIVLGQVRQIDLGRANGRLFFNVAHIGLGARVRTSLSPEMKRHWGSFSYVRALVQAMADRRPFRVTVEADGKIQRIRSIQVAIGNGRHYGGGMTVDEDAEIDDGLLHVYTVAPLGVWRLGRMVAALSRGVVKDRGAVQQLRAGRLTLKTDRRMRVVADGEPITFTPVEFDVLPKALAVYAGRRKEPK